MRLTQPVDLRPLDPIRSIKAKLALLVAASISVSALLTFLCLVVFGWRARYGLTVSVLVGLLVSQLLARGMTSPLRQMTAAAREMADGRPPGSVTTASRDEVGDLARAFVAMADDLATADAQRRDLLANVAHELRTPVAALRAQLENLVDGVRPADETALGEVLDQVENLGGLVDDLLGLARAEAGVTLLQPCRVPVAELIASVVADVGPVRPDRRIELDVPDGLIAELDPARVRQVLVNLVDNATRHAPPGGLVQVRARLGSDGALVIEVTDDGPGIPPEEWSSVFERFRHGSHRESPTGGTGLGLAIARWAVSLHGGRIEVVPAPAGCRIRAELPPPATRTQAPTS